MLTGFLSAFDNRQRVHDDDWLQAWKTELCGSRVRARPHARPLPPQVRDNRLATRDLWFDELDSPGGHRKL